MAAGTKDKVDEIGCSHEQAVALGLNVHFPALTAYFCYCGTDADSFRAEPPRSLEQLISLFILCIRQRFHCRTKPKHLCHQTNSLI
jgi:hypothetical protein